MSQQTDRYKLVKPEGSETYDIAVPNGNMDKIEQGLVYRSRTGNGKPAHNPTTDHEGDRFYDTTNKKEYVFNGTSWVDIEAGKSYAQGDGIIIGADNKISVDDTREAKKDDLDAHTGDTKIHVTETDKTAWNGKSKVVWTQEVTTGTEIAKIKIDDGSEISVKAPTSGGGSYTAGNGINIDASNKISAKAKTDGGVIVDADGISVDKDKVFPEKVANMYLHVNADGTTVEWAAAGSGSANWGSIGGTLADQTDLKAALDSKVDATVSSADVGKFLKVKSYDTTAGTYVTEWAEGGSGGDAVHVINLTGKLSIAELYAGKEFGDKAITDEIGVALAGKKAVMLHVEGNDAKLGNAPTKLDMFVRASLQVTTGTTGTVKAYEITTDMITSYDVAARNGSVSPYTFIIAQTPFEGKDPIDKWFAFKISDVMKKELADAFVAKPTAAGTAGDVLTLDTDGVTTKWAKGGSGGKTYTGEGFVTVDNTGTEGKIALNSKVGVISTILDTPTAGEDFINVKMKQVTSGGADQVQSVSIGAYDEANNKAGVVSKAIMDTREKIANKVTTVGDTSTDTEYPTAKAVNDKVTTAVSTKQDTLVSGTNIKTVQTHDITGSGDLTLFTDTAVAGDEAHALTAGATYALIQNLGGRYRGSVETFADLSSITSPADKDNAIVRVDEKHASGTTRYYYDLATTTWLYMFTVTTTALSAEQIAALDSTITLEKVQKYEAYATSKQDKLPSGLKGQALVVRNDAGDLMFTDIAVDVDSVVSDISKNPVQNKVVKAYIDEQDAKDEKLSNKIKSSTVTPTVDEQYYNAIIVDNKINAVDVKIAAKEDVANKTTTIDNTSTDIQYPSAKAVYDLVGDADFQETLVSGTNIKTVNGKSVLVTDPTEVDIPIIDDSSSGSYNVTYSQATIDAKIVSVSGRMRGIFETKAALDAATAALNPQNNDNVIVRTDETQENKTTKYVWVAKEAPEVSEWQLLSDIGSYTPEEMAVLQSGINATKVAKYEAYPTTLQTKIRYGTAKPTGGEEGDLYCQVGVAATRQLLFDLAHPIGERYVQYPDALDPNELYNSPSNGIACTWEDITNTVDSRFAEFVNAEAVGGMRDEKLPDHTHVQTKCTKPGAHTHGVGTYSVTGQCNGVWSYNGRDYNKTLSLNTRGWGYHTNISIWGGSEFETCNISLNANKKDGFTGKSDEDGDHEHTVTLGNASANKAVYGGTVVQPAAFTVKLWKRTA